LNGDVEKFTLSLNIYVTGDVKSKKDEFTRKAKWEREEQEDEKTAFSSIENLEIMTD
jgi:hypothetical protein